MQLIIDSNLFTVEHICLIHCKGKLDNVSAHSLRNHFIPKKPKNKTQANMSQYQSHKCVSMQAIQTQGSPTN